MGKITKLLIFSDLHHGNIMPDTLSRLEKILQSAYQEHVDGILNLGDFAWAIEENQSIAKIWNTLSPPHYLVIGNHDLDLNDKAQFIDFFKLKNNYYSFDINDFHFIVLDTNYFKVDGKDYDYANGNYYGYEREYISLPQLEWLVTEVRSTDKPCILLSHARLNYSSKNAQGGCGNYEEVHNLLEKLNQESGWSKVCMAINGHNHTDSYQYLDGIHYLDINSASNEWLGDDCLYLEPNETFDSLAHQNYPYVKYTIPYLDPLFAILSLDYDNNRMILKGTTSTFVGKSPEERGHSGIVGGTKVTAKISDLNLILFNTCPPLSQGRFTT